MPYGIPKTEEERKTTHLAIFGDEAPAKRGNPMSKEDYAKNLQNLANLETIRVNQFVPFNLFIQKTDGSNNTTSQKVEFDVFESGYIYIITGITAYDPDDAAHQIRIGIKDGATYTVYESATVANAGDSVEYVGQLMCKETDIIYAEFRAVGASDSLYVVMNGYKIRR